MLLDNQKMVNHIHFETWDPDHVAEWLRGLDMDGAIIPYVHYFLNSRIDGKKLMLLTHADLEKLNVTKLGHQELILEAVDLLRSLRYGYETENLQSLALQLGCKARSLNSEIRYRTGENDKNKANVAHRKMAVTPRRLSVGILSSVADLIGTLKSLVSWLDRVPFCGFHDLCLVRNTIVKLGLDLINVCQREASVPDVETNMANSTRMLSDICEELVIGSQDRPVDPLYVQPASLELATIRKKQGEELGMHILSSYYGVHVISGIKDMSPADLCGKIEKGDEVIQVNYQTVVGWQLKKLVEYLKEKPKEVILLLKKRPRHVSPYGQMPNKKNKLPGTSTLPKLKTLRSREGEPKQMRPSLQEFVNSVPSTSDELYSPKETIDGNDTDNDVFRSGSESPQFTLPVQVDPKQRRATVSGGSPTLSRPLLVIEDIDTPTRPKSFTIASTSADMPTTEIVINSPQEGDSNLLGFHKFASANEKRKEYKTKSTPPSLEFSVRKPTPKIMEPKKDSGETTPGDITPVTSSTAIFIQAPDSDVDTSPKGSELATIVDSGAGDALQYRPSPDRPADSSTDSVPPSLESSIDSSQTRTSSLESSSHSPPLDDSLVSSEKEDIPVFVDQAVTSAGHHSLEAPPTIRNPQPHKLEVAGTEYDKNQPQLLKIRKIGSLHLSDGEASAPQRTGGSPKLERQERQEKHVAFGNLSDSDESQSFVHIVVGGVVHKIPAKGSPSESPSTVKRRQKTGRGKKVDRRISCKDLGKGDCEGWLYRRREKGGGAFSSHWQMRWCVLKNLDLFYYKDKEAEKAEGVVHLPAFQVSPITQAELKTKKYAFKIHNTGTSFYFASERQDDMTKWMNKMGLAAITFDPDGTGGFRKPRAGKYKGNSKEYYSESESEDETGSVGGNSSASASGSQGAPSPRQSLQSNNDDRGSKTDQASDLRVPAPEMGASSEDLTVMYRKLERADLTFDGINRDKLRRSVLSREMEQQVSPQTMHAKRVKSLQRTLKSKEKELQELDSLLEGKITPEKLKFAKEQLAQSSPRTVRKAQQK